MFRAHMALRETVRLDMVRRRSTVRFRNKDPQIRGYFSNTGRRPFGCLRDTLRDTFATALPAPAVPAAGRRPSAAPDRAILLLPGSRPCGRRVAAFQGGLVGDQDLV